METVKNILLVVGGIIVFIIMGYVAMVDFANPNQSEIECSTMRLC